MRGDKLVAITRDLIVMSKVRVHVRTQMFNDYEYVARLAAACDTKPHVPTIERAKSAA